MYLFIEDNDVTQYEELPGGLDLLDDEALVILHISKGVARRYIDGEFVDVERE